MAGAARICSGVPSEPQQLLVLFGSTTSLNTSAFCAPGRMMKNCPLSVPTKILPSANAGGAFCAVPRRWVQSSLPVSVSKARSVEPLSI